MQIVETFPAPETKAGHLFWLPAYVRLAKEVYAGFLKTGETSEATRFAGNCASRWGVSRRVALALLAEGATYEVNPLFITVTRTVTEE